MDASLKDAVLDARSNRAAMPYQAYIDPAVFALEQERIFEGPLWHYLCLEAEIEDKHSFVTTTIGTTPVVITRGSDGEVFGFVNRCAHRGALVVREKRGTSRWHTCLYHQWVYDEQGALRSVPYRNGLRGNGGFDKDFDLACHGLRKVNIRVLHGIVFGTLSDKTPPIEEFLGPKVLERLGRIYNRPLRLLGYHRQSVRANWKMMLENIKDTYHGALLHAFNSRFGFFRPTQPGEVYISDNGFHSVVSTYKVEQENIGDAFKDVATAKADLTLEDKTMIARRPEFHDATVTTLMSIGATFLFYHIGNSFVIRTMHPKSADDFDMTWTYFGYADDTAEMTDLRLRQINLGGPAGYVSMEDAVALEAAQEAIKGDMGRGEAIAALAGDGTKTQHHLVTEVALRGFWEAYYQVMAGMPASPTRLENGQ